MDIEITIDLKKHRHPRRRTRASEAPDTTRIPRITRLMALAIRFQDMADRGEVRDYADLARLGHVTRTRITQIMNLLNLAPDIQERILFLAPEALASDNIGEKRLRKLTGLIGWGEQRQLWPHEC
ncbi:MAG: hypothetical protein HY238_16575 [Acidobacteria bacterium]|nr:hypothetical protein [Acidobacteriota bacterium]